MDTIGNGVKWQGLMSHGLNIKPYKTLPHPKPSEISEAMAFWRSCSFGSHYFWDVHHWGSLIRRIMTRNPGPDLLHSCLQPPLDPLGLEKNILIGYTPRIITKESQNGKPPQKKLPFSPENDDQPPTKSCSLEATRSGLGPTRLSFLKHGSGYITLLGAQPSSKWLEAKLARDFPANMARWEMPYKLEV